MVKRLATVEIPDYYNYYHYFLSAFRSVSAVIIKYHAVTSHLAPTGVKSGLHFLAYQTLHVLFTLSLSSLPFLPVIISMRFVPSCLASLAVLDRIHARTLSFHSSLHTVNPSSFLTILFFPSFLLTSFIPFLSPNIFPKLHSLSLPHFSPSIPLFLTPCLPQPSSLAPHFHSHVRLCIRPSVLLWFVRPSVRSSVQPSVRGPSALLSVCPSIRLSVHLSIHPQPPISLLLIPSLHPNHQPYRPASLPVGRL